MSERYVKMGFRFKIEYTDFKAEFYHEADPLIPDSTTELFRKNPNDVAIFIQIRTKQAFTAPQMLAWYLHKTGSELKDYIPDEATEAAGKTGEGVSKHRFPMAFDRGSFQMMTDHGQIDLKHLTLFVVFRVHPKQQ